MTMTLPRPCSPHTVKLSLPPSPVSSPPSSSPGGSRKSKKKTKPKHKKQEGGTTKDETANTSTDVPASAAGSEKKNDPAKEDATANTSAATAAAAAIKIRPSSPHGAQLLQSKRFRKKKKQKNQSANAPSPDSSPNAMSSAFSRKKAAPVVLPNSQPMTLFALAERQAAMSNQVDQESGQPVVPCLKKHQAAPRKAGPDGGTSTSKTEKTKTVTFATNAFNDKVWNLVKPVSYHREEHGQEFEQDLYWWSEQELEEIRDSILQLSANVEDTYGATLKATYQAIHQQHEAKAHKKKRFRLKTSSSSFSTGRDESSSSASSGHNENNSSTDGAVDGINTTQTTEMSSSLSSSASASTASSKSNKQAGNNNNGVTDPESFFQTVAKFAKARGLEAAVAWPVVTDLKTQHREAVLTAQELLREERSMISYMGLVGQQPAARSKARGASLRLMDDLDLELVRKRSLKHSRTCRLMAARMAQYDAMPWSYHHHQPEVAATEDIFWAGTGTIPEEDEEDDDDDYDEVTVSTANPHQLSSSSSLFDEVTVSTSSSSSSSPSVVQMDVAAAAAEAAEAGVATAPTHTFVSV